MEYYVNNPVRYDRILTPLIGVNAVFRTNRIGPNILSVSFILGMEPQYVKEITVTMLAFIGYIFWNDNHCINRLTFVTFRH